MNRRIRVSFFSVIFLVFFLSFIFLAGSGRLVTMIPRDNNDNSTVSSMLQANNITIGVVLANDYFYDPSFNEMINESLQNFKTAHSNMNISLNFQKPNNSWTSDDLLRRLANGSLGITPDVVIGVGYDVYLDVWGASQASNTTFFISIDSEFPCSDNVYCITFEENEQAFLAGTLAAMKTTTKKVGFLGLWGTREPFGANSPSWGVGRTLTSLAGFTAGANLYDLDVEVVIDYVDSDTNLWINSNKAKTAAGRIYDKGADVLYAPVGAKNLEGVKDAAKDAGKKFIGSDSNFSTMYTESGYLGSITKKADDALSFYLDNVYFPLNIQGGTPATGGKLSFGITDNIFEALGPVVDQEFHSQHSNIHGSLTVETGPRIEIPKSIRLAMTPGFTLLVVLATIISLPVLKKYRR